MFVVPVWLTYAANERDDRRAGHPAWSAGCQWATDIGRGIPRGPTATDVILGLRPVDAVMFLFYLVLLVLGVVAGVRSAVWFVALGLSVV